MSFAAQPAMAPVAGAGNFSAEPLRLCPVAAFRGMRALLWHGKTLYTCRGYELYRVEPAPRRFEWELVGRFRPAWWRRLSSSHQLGARLFRDGFHCLAKLASGDLVGAVPGAIVRCSRGHDEFTITHRVQRGTRPLHIASTPDGRVFWGEYFDNRRRDEVHIYASADCGRTWEIAYTFPRGAIRHIHNIVFDEHDGRLWILTGDEGDECKILRASPDFSDIEVVLCGDQQARAVALVPTSDAIYFASDTPLEANHVYRIDRHDGRTRSVAKIASSSIQGCRVGDSIFFSSMAEPSAINDTGSVRLYGSNGSDWQCLKQWRKDRWPMRFFQYGNVFLPTGRNQTDL
ncbi:MAG TPA: hypothetical protein VE994_20210, partial [Terriglobales bacterium]|nr:hypothetical protein [Terriglobales bacterium]